MSSFTHLDAAGNPSMVDVGNKNVTRRTAVAQAIVVLGDEIMDKLENQDIQTKKARFFKPPSLPGLWEPKGPAS